MRVRRPILATSGSRDAPRDARRPGIRRSGADGFERRLVLAVGVEDQIAQPVLGRGVDDGPQQREAAPLAVHRVLARRERHRPAAAAPLPDREADELQAVERAAREVQLRIRQLARRVAPVVRDEQDARTTTPPPWAGCTSAFSRSPSDAGDAERLQGLGEHETDRRA